MWSSHSNEFKRSVLRTLSSLNRNGLLSSVTLKGKIEFEFILLRNFKSCWRRFWDQFVLINSNLDDYLLFIAESSQKMKKNKNKKMKTFWVEEKVYFSDEAQISGKLKVQFAECSLEILKILVFQFSGTSEWNILRPTIEILKCAQ